MPALVKLQIIKHVHKHDAIHQGATSVRPNAQWEADLYLLYLFQHGASIYNVAGAHDCSCGVCILSLRSSAKTPMKLHE